MKWRWAFAGLFLLASAAIAASPQLRSVALEQLRRIAEPLFQSGASTDPRFDQFYTGMVEQLPVQERAERALELAINRFAGAPEYVIQQADAWRGQIKPTDKLGALIATAINAPLIEVRMAGFELYLSQFNLEKSAAEVERLLARWHKDPQRTGPWALWSLGVMAARGVEREHIYGELLRATLDADETIRRWSVDALAKLGGSEIVEPLLSIAVNDASALVRERAFCGLAQSGTLLIAERYDALPGLLMIAEDPRSDKQTLGWTYQAMREISGIYDLPEEASAWRTQLAESGLLPSSAVEVE